MISKYFSVDGRLKAFAYLGWLTGLLATTTLQAQALPIRTLATLPSTISETSGLICTGPNRLWSHNDSGGEAKLYQIDTLGTILRTLVVRGVANVDWEDITQDDAGRVYVGDFGNNGNDRSDLAVLRLPMLDTVTGDTVTPERIAFTYPDQQAFPPVDPLKNFDMEAFVALGDSLYLFSKNRTVPFDGFTKLYRLPQVPGNYVAELIDSFFTGPGPMLNYWIAGAALSPGHDRLLLMSYARCWIFSCFEGADFFGGAVVQRTWAFTQKEAGAWLDSTHLYLTDELLGNLGGTLYVADMKAFAAAPDAELGPDTLLYVGDTLWLTAPTNPSGSLLWSTGSTAATIGIVQSGVYSLAVTAANGCTAFDSVFVEILTHLDAANDGMQIQASPNPCDGTTNVVVHSPKGLTMNWRLLDAWGRMSQSGTLQMDPAGSARIHFDGLKPGIYLLQVWDGFQSHVLRLIVA